MREEKFFPRVECWLIHVKRMKGLEHYHLKIFVRWWFRQETLLDVAVGGWNLMVKGCCWSLRASSTKILLNYKGGDGDFAVERLANTKMIKVILSVVGRVDVLCTEWNTVLVELISPDHSLPSPAPPVSTCHFLHQRFYSCSEITFICTVF